MTIQRKRTESLARDTGFEPVTFGSGGLGFRERLQHLAQRSANHPAFELGCDLVLAALVLFAALAAAVYFGIPVG